MKGPLRRGRVVVLSEWISGFNQFAGSSISISQRTSRCKMSTRERSMVVVPSRLTTFSAGFEEFPWWPGCHAHDGGIRSEGASSTKNVRYATTKIGSQKEYVSQLGTL